MEYLIQNVEVMQADGACLPARDVLIQNDRFGAIAPHPELSDKPVQRRIDGRSKLMVPGFINAHLHSHDRFDKGRFDNLPLELWMAAYNPPLGRRPWTPEDCYLRTLLNVLDLVKSGVTTVIDDCFHTDITDEPCIDAVYRAYEDAGLRAVVTIAYADRAWYETIPFLSDLLPPGIKQETRPTIPPSHALGVWKNFATRWRGRVGFGVSTSGVQRCTGDFLKTAWNLARELGVPAFIHTLESKVQQLSGYLFYGQSLVEYLDGLGLLGPECNLIHGVWLSEQDIRLVARSGAKVIHNPVSNLRLGSGIAPIAELIEAGVPVGVGTDNNGCNDSANLMETLKTAALISKVTTSRFDRWIGAKEAFGMATAGGAACALKPDTGEIRAGKKADFSLFDLRSPSFFPAHNRLYQLVYAESGQSLDTVAVDGRLIMEGGTILTFDEQDLRSRLFDRQEHILSLIKSASERNTELLPHLEKAYTLCHRLADVSSVKKPPILA